MEIENESVDGPNFTKYDGRFRGSESCFSWGLAALWPTFLSHGHVGTYVQYFELKKTIFSKIPNVNKRRREAN